MTEKAYDEKRAWGIFKKTAPQVGSLVNGKAGKGGAADQRHKLEKPPVAKDDGRRAKATGRTKVFNTKLKPEFRDKLFALANERKIGVAELLELIVGEWEQTKAKRN
jgi:hypothetical protein